MSLRSLWTFLSISSFTSLSPDSLFTTFSSTWMDSLPLPTFRLAPCSEILPMASEDTMTDAPLSFLTSMVLEMSLLSTETSFIAAED